MYCTCTKNPNCSKQFIVKQPLGSVLKNRYSKICGNILEQNLQRTTAYNITKDELFRRYFPKILTTDLPGYIYEHLFFRTPIW